MTMIQALEYLIGIAEISDRKLNKMYNDPSSAFVRWTSLGYCCYSHDRRGLRGHDRANDYKEKMKDYLGERASSFRFRIRNTFRGYDVQVRTLTDAEKKRYKK